MTPRSPTIGSFCYLPFFQVLHGPDNPDLRLALYRIIDNPRTTLNILL